MTLRQFIICGAILLCISALAACLPKEDNNGQEPVSGTGEDMPVPEGMKRLTLRFNADLGIFADDMYPIDIASKTVIVNGVGYSPCKDPKSGNWFVDVESSAFNVTVAYLLEEDSPEQWYGENPASNIRIPSIQFLHKKEDLSAIPLFAIMDSSLGDCLDFRPPYAVLDFSIPGDITSVKLSSSSATCGLASWHRSDDSFVYEGSSRELILNCTGMQENTSGHYPVIVFGNKLSDVKIRVCDSRHNCFEAQLGDIDLSPGDMKKLSITDSSPQGLLWFEGFDLCTWGGNPVEAKTGLYPSAEAPGLSGDESLDGYEYAFTSVDSTFPGSGFIQQTFQDNMSTVVENHSMSDSFIKSRGFDEYQYMLRCRECPGFISVGTGSGGRGIFSLYPLKDIGSVKNLEVSFRLCLDSSVDDAVQFITDGSSSVIRAWYLDGIKGDSDLIDMRRTTSSLTMDKEALGGSGQWKTVRVLIDNCTDATTLRWQAASPETGNHGFYLDEISVREIPGSWISQGGLRILYWNIQNGMWANQYDYGQFIDFVNRYSPDICVWCEAKTNYESNSDAWIDIEAPSYLPDNWEELAARYGHSYVGISRRDKEAFPQVVTSRFPIDKLLQLGYITGEEPILHGAGLFRVNTPAGGYYFVTLHLNPNPEQDGERLREITRIIEATVLNDHWNTERGWFVLGDFNSHSRKDSQFLALEEDSPKFATHDFIASNTSLVDLIAARYPGKYLSTTYGSSRFDYIYMDPESYSKVQNAGVLTTQWTAPAFSGYSNFYIPSDHRPILVDINY